MDNFYTTMSLRQVENNEMLLNITSKQTEWLTNDVSESNMELYL